MTSFDLLCDAVVRSGLSRAARIVVALSGGPDSVALLESLRVLATDPDRGWKLRAVHVNHQLRGEEAEADEIFVRELCANLDIELDVAYEDTRKYAAEERLSIETAARFLRYRALRQTLVEWPGDVIVTGHTQDDQAETVLLRLLRGAGLIGLSAMSPQSDRLVRPFLSVRHAVILTALRERGLACRTDSSNQDPRHLRNRVRAELVPVLTALQPRAIELLSRTAGLAQIDSSYLLREANRVLPLLITGRQDQQVVCSLGVWRSLHPSLRGHSLRLVLASLLPSGKMLDESHLQAITRYLEGGKAAQLSGQLPFGLRVFKHGEVFTVTTGEVIGSASLSSGQLTIPGELDIGIGVLRAEIREAGGEELDRWVTVCGPYHVLCDARSLGCVLTVRGRRPGDRIRPLGMSATRKIQDVLVDRKIPIAVRDNLPVVESEGRIMWIPGACLSAEAAIRSDTESVVHLVYEPFA